MAGVNKVIIVGNLGQDVEFKVLPNGTPVANVSVATSESWQDKNTGERKEITEWHRIVLYRRLAEIANEYLRKGSKVYIEGKLKTRKWQDQQTGQDRYMTEIQADNLQMLDSKNQSQQGGNQGYQAPPPQPQQQYNNQRQPKYNNNVNNNGGYQRSTQTSQQQPQNNNSGGFVDDAMPF